MPTHPPARVLVVDDDEQIRTLIDVLLTGLGYEVEEASRGDEGLDGLEVLGRLRSEPSTRLLPVVMLTGATGRREKLRAIEGGVTDFIAKPFDAEELTARVQALVRLGRLVGVLEEAEEVIAALARMIDARDPSTAAHSERVSAYAVLLGERAGLSGPDLQAVRRGALFHDIGKIGIRDAVLMKPGPLTPEERHEMQRHPGDGSGLLRQMRSLADALPVVRHHHERMDGSGYPDGLMGEAIPLIARVASIADVFDTLTSMRVYRSPMSTAEAIEVMRQEAARGWWDARLLEEFVAALPRAPRTGAGAAPLPPAPPAGPSRLSGGAGRRPLGGSRP